MPPVKGLSVDLGASDNWFGQSATSIATGIGTGNFAVLLPRIRILNNGDNYHFGIFNTTSDYILFNSTPGSGYLMWAEWSGGGTVRSCRMKLTAPNNNWQISAGLTGMVLWRDGTALKLGSLDFGCFTGTAPQLQVVGEFAAGTLVAGHTFATLDAGRYQLNRYNTSNVGRTAFGPMFVVKFGATVWTEAQLESALMDPSSIPALAAATGATIVAQFDDLSRSGVSIIPTDVNTWRTAIATGDLIVDSVGGKNITITAGTGTSHVYTAFSPVDRDPIVHNVLFTTAPTTVIDPLGGYWHAMQTRSSSGFGVQYLVHLDSNGVPDRHPIPIPYAHTYYDEATAGGTPTAVPWHGEIYPAGNFGVNMLPEYHAGMGLGYDGAGNLICYQMRHSLYADTNGAPSSPLVANKFYLQGAPHYVIPSGQQGDLHSGVITTLNVTLPATGVTSDQYYESCRSYEVSDKVGDHLITANRAAGGGTGYIVIQRITNGVVAQTLKLNACDVVGTGSWPVAVVRLGLNAFAVFFTLRETVNGNGTGLRMLVCRNANTLSSWTNAVGNSVTLPIAHSTMVTADATGTDVTGFGTVAADCGVGQVLGNGKGLILIGWCHQVGNNGSYSGARTRLKIRTYNHDGATLSEPMDLTPLLNSHIPNFFSTSGKNVWASPFFAWANPDQTQAVLMLTDPDGNTMTPDGVTLGGCPVTDTFGVRVVALLINRLLAPVVTYHGTIYTCNNAILSVDVHPAMGHTLYTDRVFMQGYVAPADSFVGRTKLVSAPLAAVTAAASAIETRLSARPSPRRST